MQRCYDFPYMLLLLLLHPFNGLFSRTTQENWYQKSKTILDFNEARDTINKTKTHTVKPRGGNTRIRSRFSPPSNSVNGHVSTMWFMVRRWPQSQEGDSDTSDTMKMVTPIGWSRRPVHFAGKHVHRPAKFLHRGSCRLERTST